MSYLKTPSRLVNWLDHSSRLGSYYVKTKELLTLNHWWKQQNIAIAAHSDIVNYNDTTVILSVEHSGWATHLHYSKREIIQCLKGQKRCQTITAVKGYVRNPHAPNATQLNTLHTIRLSEKNKQLLKAVADNIKQPSLKAALYRLATVKMNDGIS